MKNADKDSCSFHFLVSLDGISDATLMRLSLKVCLKAETGYSKTAKSVNTPSEFLAETSETVNTPSKNNFWQKHHEV